MAKNRRVERKNGTVIYPNGRFSYLDNYSTSGPAYPNEGLNKEDETSSEEEIDIEGLPPVHTLAGPPPSSSLSRGHIMEGPAPWPICSLQTSDSRKEDVVNLDPKTSPGQTPLVPSSTLTTMTTMTSMPHPSPVYPPSYPVAPLRQSLEAAQALCSLGYGVGVQSAVSQPRPLPNLSTILSSSTFIQYPVVSTSSGSMNQQVQGAGHQQNL